MNKKTQNVMIWWGKTSIDSQLQSRLFCIRMIYSDTVYNSRRMKRISYVNQQSHLQAKIIPLIYKKNLKSRWPWEMFPRKTFNIATIRRERCKWIVAYTVIFDRVFVVKIQKYISFLSFIPIYVTTPTNILMITVQLFKVKR